MKGTIVSVEQPQVETSNSSPTTPENWREKLQERWMTALGKMKLMPAMLGWESVRRGMQAEDELARKDALAYHELLHGKADGSSSDEGDGMGHMVLGDMTIEHRYPSPPSPVKKGLGTLAKLAIGAGLLGTGVGVGLGFPLLLDALTPVAVETKEIPGETTTIIRDWELGKPIVE